MKLIYKKIVEDIKKIIMRNEIPVIVKLGFQEYQYLRNEVGEFFGEGERSEVNRFAGCYIEVVEKENYFKVIGVKKGVL